MAVADVEVVVVGVAVWVGGSGEGGEGESEEEGGRCGEVADFDEEVFAESAADAAVGEFDEFFVGAAESGVA